MCVSVCVSGTEDKQVKSRPLFLFLCVDLTAEHACLFCSNVGFPKKEMMMQLIFGGFPASFYALNLGEAMMNYTWTWFRSTEENFAKKRRYCSFCEISPPLGKQHWQHQLSQHQNRRRKKTRKRGGVLVGYIGPYSANVGSLLRFHAVSGGWQFDIAGRLAGRVLFLVSPRRHGSCWTHYHVPPHGKQGMAGVTVRDFQQEEDIISILQPRREGINTYLLCVGYLSYRRARCVCVPWEPG